MFDISSKLNCLLTEYLRASQSDQLRAQEHLLGTGEVRELEQKIAHFYKARYALCVSNATTGILAVADALNLRETSFITSPYNYGASLASLLLLGNKPIFTDIECETLTLDPKKVPKGMTKQTKAIFTVDIFGNPSDIRSLRRIADEFGLWLIADCAQSFGAERDGVAAGCLADALIISFTTGKTLFAGEGGAVVTDNKDLYEKLVWLTQHTFRQKRELGLRTVNEFAFNGRINPLTAIWANFCFGEALERLQNYQNKCLEIIDCLNESRLITPINLRTKNILPTFFQLTVELRDKLKANEVKEYLLKQGFKTKIVPLSVSVIYKNPAFIEQYKKQFYLPESCSIAEQQAERRIAIGFVNE
jgi:dTDP-4-amino-4,6-dideoxygalactose transaminase